jgi:hypothetical protein
MLTPSTSAPARTHAVHTESRSRLGAHARQRYIAQVMEAATFCNRFMPVVVRNKILGWVGGTSDGRVHALEHRDWMDSWIDREGMLMGFPTVDSVLAVTQNTKMENLFWQKEFVASTFNAQAWHHMWGTAGFPNAGAWSGTARVAQQYSDQSLGALMHAGNVSTDTKHILSVGVRTGLLSVTEACVHVPYDLVIAYNNCDFNNASQNYDNTLTAQRYISGSDGPAYGLQIMGVQTSVVASGVNFTAANPKYTSITGTPPQGLSMVGPTFTIPVLGTAPSSIQPWPSAISYTNSTVMSCLTMPLRTGDQGVKQLDSYQLASTVGAQTFSMILGFPLGWFPSQMGDFPFLYDCVKQLPSACARIRDGACITSAIFSALSTENLAHGHMTVGWGT